MKDERLIDRLLRHTLRCATSSNLEEEIKRKDGKVGDCLNVGDYHVATLLVMTNVK
jgi:hypothetical protein